jgi:hypothetical protein
MRRVLALAVPVAALALAGPATGATWKKYVDANGGLAWSYDADYTYKDRQSGRLVVLQAVSKPEAHIGPGEPGADDGVGNVVALDCAKKNMIMLGSYKPSVPLEIKETWRLDTPKKAEGADNEALIAAVCPTANSAPVK